MAFTLAQKDVACGHLGYQVSEWAIAFVGNRMDAVAALSSDAETRCGTILTTLTTIETQLNTYRAASAGIQVLTDGSVYYQGGAISELNNQYSYWLNKLSVLLDVPIYMRSSAINSQRINN